MTHTLQDKTLLNIEVSADKGSITFITTEESVTATCYAEHCSETWIEHVELPALGFPAKVLDVIELNFPSKWESEYDYIQYYGLKIVTDRGEIIIDYRNNSNGCYGGDLDFPDKIC